ncbi:MAG: 50S ribosomal protein L30 [Desulfurococcales archaeon]|nr:50S ribosomal protein L30 [Desulfurococcales archaeon]
MSSGQKLFLVIRIRGTVGLRPGVRYTLDLLRLRRKFTATLYHSSLNGLRDMLRKVEYWTTYGEIDKETLVQLLEERGRVAGDKPLTSEWVKENLGLNGIEELADKLLSGELHYHKLEKNGVKPFFKLHPPRKGFEKTIKRHYHDEGELGYRASDINGLLKRMI